MEELLLRAELACIYGAFEAIVYGIITFLGKKKRRLPSSLSTFMGYVPGLVLFVPSMALILRERDKLRFLHGALQLLPELFLFTLLLLALAPWLRRRYSARSCADLWVLPGVMTHIFIYYWRVPWDPWVTVRLPRFLLWLLLGLWLTGFCAVLGWKLVEHLRFRRAILRGAGSPSDHEWYLFQEVLWSLAPEDRLCRSLKFFHSSAVASPLAIGLFRKTTCLVLPDRDYSDEELRLIFRHEAIHLLREDNWAKFSTVFLCALGWFLPSMWAVMRRASEDLELCCDELAVRDLEADTRKEYVRLILDSAGTELGFTTCLSASAKGLRYRLRRVLRQRKGRNAALLIGLLTALFVFLFGTVGLELEVGTIGSELLDGTPGGWRVTAVDADGDWEYCKDPAVLEAVEAYLRDLALTRPLWAEYERAYTRGDAGVTLTCEDGQIAGLLSKDDEVYFQPWNNSDPMPRYRVVGGLDLDRLRSMTGGG